MVEKIVVDTNIIIDIFERDNSNLLLKLAPYDTYISYVTLYEYLYGYYYLGKNYLKEKNVLEKVFKVVYPTQDLLLQAMEIDVKLTKKGERIPQADILIASTAILLNAPLLTKDLKHFKKLEEYGLKIVTVRDL